METQSALDIYMIKAFRAMLVLLILSALGASLTILALKLLGVYTMAGWPPLLLFLATNVAYILAGRALNRRILTKGLLNKKTLRNGKSVLVIAVAVQYNFLLYLVPSRDIWYLSFLFLLVTGLFLDFKLSLIVASELAFFSVVSIFTWGDLLLSVREDYAYTLLVVQVIAVAFFYGISLASIYLLNKFLVFASDRRVSVALEDLESTKETANTDPLTGLFNRRYADVFFNAILAEKEENARYCVALMDVDDFKKVNDVYGHSCGDQLLIFLADYVRGCLRKSDYVFRWGGEEFLIILKGVDLSDACSILEKLCMGLYETPVETEEAVLSVSVTIGAATLDPANIAACVKACDDRLYYGKRNGKNRVIAAG
jgi:diguanylate cyclase (GGDEF)-like protein